MTLSLLSRITTVPNVRMDVTMRATNKGPQAPYWQRLHLAHLRLRVIDGHGVRPSEQAAPGAGTAIVPLSFNVRRSRSLLGGGRPGPGLSR
jgi:hypothetical protein